MTTITRDMWEEQERLKALGCRELTVLVPPGMEPMVNGYIDRLTQLLTAPDVYGRHDLMAVAAVRYCLGGSQFMQRDCCDWLPEVWPLLAGVAQEAIRAEVDSALRVEPANVEADWKRVQRLWA